FSTAASTYIAYTVPISRRAEAVGYYGVLQGLAQGFGAGVSIVIVDGMGFGALYAIAGVATVAAAILSLGLREDSRPKSATPMGAGFRLHRGVPPRRRGGGHRLRDSPARAPGACDRPRRAGRARHRDGDVLGLY